MAATKPMRPTSLSAAEMDDAEIELLSKTTEQQKNKKGLEERDLREIMAMPQGRRVIARILNLTAHRVDPFVAGSPDVTSRNTGRAFVGKTLEDILVATCFQEFLTMLRENKERGDNADG